MKKILFLCTGNSCRSQMAEGWARELFADKVTAFSAGITTHGLNPHAVAVMAEAGVDISHQQSKKVASLTEKFDLVITVCDNAHETCPLFPGKCQVIHHSFPDPPQEAKMLAEKGATEAEQLLCYRQVRDQIKLFIQNELAKLIEKAEKGDIHTRQA